MVFIINKLSLVLLMLIVFAGFEEVSGVRHVHHNVSRLAMTSGGMQVDYADELNSSNLPSGSRWKFTMYDYYLKHVESEELLEPCDVFSSDLKPGEHYKHWREYLPYVMGSFEFKYRGNKKVGDEYKWTFDVTYEDHFGLAGDLRRAQVGTVDGVYRKQGDSGAAAMEIWNRHATPEEWWPVLGFKILMQTRNTRRASKFKFELCYSTYSAELDEELTALGKLHYNSTRHQAII